MTGLGKVISTFAARDPAVWDALWQRRALGRVAVVVMPNEDRLNNAKQTCANLQLKESPDLRPAGWTPKWRQALVDEIAAHCAYMQLPGDFCPALRVPGFVHGQSQGICDLFGARVEPQPDDLFFVHPVADDTAWVDAVVPKPLETSQFWGAVEWIRYARMATGGRFGFRNPVMTGPLDTANYLLGTTRLMDWLYSEPEALARLLEKVTEVIIAMLGALREAAGGALYPETVYCMRGGFGLCSECRSLISSEHYDQFEAPFLRRIGEAMGTYSIHSCGSWERTLASSMADPNLRVMHGQVRENDLALLCRLSAGRMTFAIGPSINLCERYIWKDMKDFYAHVLKNVPLSQPLEMQVNEADLPHLNATYRNSPVWKPLEPA